jgi:hypothetical protein
MEASVLFLELGYNMGNTLILFSYIASTSLGLFFMSSLSKGIECAQSGRTHLLTSWLREVCGKHDKFYQRRRACIEKR